MDILDWSGPGEVKEMQCSSKSITVQCWEMNGNPPWCPFGYFGPPYEQYK